VSFLTLLLLFVFRLLLLPVFPALCILINILFVPFVSLTLLGFIVVVMFLLLLLLLLMLYIVMLLSVLLFAVVITPYVLVLSFTSVTLLFI